MQFNVATSKRVSSSGSGGLAGDGGGPGGSRLSFYQNPPIDEVTFEKCEKFALDRLAVLKGVDEGKSRGRKLDDAEPLILDLWRKHMRCPSTLDSVNKDVASHFALRLAYCRTADLQRWFLNMETAVFRARFRAESSEAQRRVMEDVNLPYKSIGASEFEVPFEEVPELVAGRRVYLQRGFAFVPRTHLASIVVGQFRARLSKALLLVNRCAYLLTVIDLPRVVDSLSLRYLGADFFQPTVKGEVGLQDLDKFEKKSFPLCMSHLFGRLHEEHHLKFWGRQQLGLFLKGIGLKLEDALTFWRSEFSFKMSTEKFDKDYAYAVRHNYGREGKRVDYTPYSCMKVITFTPGVGDHHGCPFRHFSQDNLRASFERLSISGGTLDGIMEKVRAHHYQLACGAMFEAVHGYASDGINHPNQYFEQSRKLQEAEQTEKIDDDPEDSRGKLAPVGSPVRLPNRALVKP